MKKLDIAAAALLIVGGLNWGLVAIAEFNLVSAGRARVRRPTASRVIYGWSAPQPSTRWPSSTPSDGAGARDPRVSTA